MTKAHLDNARRNKNDEFYTQYGDIAKQVQQLQSSFIGKTVYCNCDSTHSNFYKYFHDNFTQLGLERLIVTGWNPETGQGEKIEYDGTSLHITTPYPYDYAHPDNLRILKQDNLIVCTNPPFSMLRQYLPTVFDSGAGFLIVANLLIFKYRALIPYVLADDVFWTTNRQGFNFYRGDGTIKRVGLAVFVTNLGQRPAHNLPLVDKTPKEYEIYDDHPNRIETGSIFNIPRTFEGEIGVPIAYMFHHDPKKFRLVNVLPTGALVGGKNKFSRVIIQHRPAHKKNTTTQPLRRSPRMVANTANRNRQPKGTSKGGQFAPETHVAAPNDLDTTSSSSGNATLTVIGRYPNGKPRTELWRNKDGQPHRDDGPSTTVYRENGSIASESWSKNGFVHRDNGPATTSYHKNGNIESETWRQNGLLHRDDGPAFTIYSITGQVKEERWHNNGEWCRENGPATTRYYGNGNIEAEIWCKNEKRHRDDDPALITYYKNGATKTETWYENGQRHRTDGPAYTSYTPDGTAKSECWCQNGEYHRIDGPAWVDYNPDGSIRREEWWQYGEKIAPPAH